jgi:hypothetical protein
LNHKRQGQKKMLFLNDLKKLKGINAKAFFIRLSDVVNGLLLAIQAHGSELNSDL